MTDVRPFRALRYDPHRVELAKVLAPVYDVVAPEDRPVYWERDPYNALRLELTKSVEEEAATDYAETAQRLAEWRGEGVLVRDAEPACYVLRQTFTAEGGRTLARTGFLAALRLEDYAKRIVRPHERTLAGPKADRLKILLLRIGVAQPCPRLPVRVLWTKLGLNASNDNRPMDRIRA